MLICICLKLLYKYVSVLIGNRIKKQINIVVNRICQLLKNIHLFFFLLLLLFGDMKLFSINSSITLTLIDIHWSAYPIGFFLILLCLFTIIGNILIIWVISYDKTLHSSKYYYTASLALADLIVGLFVMPLAFLFEMTDDEYWLFSKNLRFFCDFWHSIDIFASTASIFCLLAIGIDRYIAITRPMAYQNSFICKRWLSILSFMWICSAALSFPAVIHLKTERIRSSPSIRFFFKTKQTHIFDHIHLDMSTIFNETVETFRECDFPDNSYYILFSSIVSFYVPLILMIYVYYCVYSVAKKESQARRIGYKQQRSKNIFKTSFEICNRRKTITHTTDNLVVDHRSSLEVITLRIHHGSYQQINQEPSNAENGNVKQKKKFWKNLSQNQKALTFVGIVMGAFVICWFPYFTYLLVSNVFLIRFKNKDHHDLVYKTLNWLGYTNSALDILVYVFTSKELRITLMKPFCKQ